MNNFKPLGALTLPKFKQMASKVYRFCIESIDGWINICGISCANGIWSCSSFSLIEPTAKLIAFTVTGFPSGFGMFDDRMLRNSR